MIRCKNLFHYFYNLCSHQNDENIGHCYIFKPKSSYPYECANCHICFSIEKNLHTHTLKQLCNVEHQKVAIIPRTVASYSTIDRMKDPQPFYCYVCGKELDSEVGLDRHQRSTTLRHFVGRTGKKTEQYPYQCDKCKVCFSSNEHLIMHKSKGYCVNSPSQLKSDKNMNSNIDDDKQDDDDLVVIPNSTTTTTVSANNNNKNTISQSQSNSSTLSSSSINTATPVKGVKLSPIPVNTAAVTNVSNSKANSRKLDDINTGEPVGVKIEVDLVGSPNTIGSDLLSKSINTNISTPRKSKRVRVLIPRGMGCYLYLYSDICTIINAYLERQLLYNIGSILVQKSKSAARDTAVSLPSEPVTIDNMDLFILDSKAKEFFNNLKE